MPLERSGVVLSLDGPEPENNRRHDEGNLINKHLYRKFPHPVIIDQEKNRRQGNRR